MAARARPRGRRGTLIGLPADGLLLQLLAEPWPYAVALLAGAVLGLGVAGWKAIPLAACGAFAGAVAAYAMLAMTARGGQDYYLAFWRDLGVDSASAERAAPGVLVLVAATLYWGAPAMGGALIGIVTRRRKSHACEGGRRPSTPAGGRAR